MKSPTKTGIADEAYAEMARRLIERRQKLQRESADVVLWAENNFYAEATVSTPVGLVQLMPYQRVSLRFMLQRFAGKFLFQTLLWSQPKKSGKTAISGLVGRWAAECWGKHGDVYFVGNDADQAKQRGYAALRTSIELNPDYNRTKDELPGQWLIRDTRARHLPTGSQVHAVATDYKGEAGANPCLTVWTELWGFVDRAATRFWAEMAPAPTRPNSLRWIETYSGFVGESELLEDLYGSIVGKGQQLTVADLQKTLGEQYEPGCFVEAQKSGDKVPLYINESAGIVAFWDSGERGRRMPWQQGEHGKRYYASEASTQTDAQFRRLHLNEWVSAESEFIPIELWDACKRPLPLNPGDETPLVVGLDAAVTGDCFGLVAVSRDPDNHENIAVRLARRWEPPPGGKINFDDPGAVLRRLSENFNVVQVCYDPHQLEYFVATYREELGLWFESFEQGGKRLTADKLLYDLIVHKRIRHDGSLELREHIQNCNAKIPKDDDEKLRLIKKSEMRKIDLAVALSMAASECLRLAL